MVEATAELCKSKLEHQLSNGNNFLQFFTKIEIQLVYMNKKCYFVI